MTPVSPDLLHITKYEVLGDLPDLFTFADGTPVRTAEDWAARRAELYASAVELQYGGMPPAPDFLEVELLYGAQGTFRTYRIHTGTREMPVTFQMKLLLPGDGRAGRYPCIVDGDMCFAYFMDKAYLSAATDEGVAWVLFDRTELAHDIIGEGRGHGQLYATYPDRDFGALAAWAWGYSRCVDALELLGAQGLPIDLTAIAFAGHSRGGKTAALAGASDTRAAVVNPNETCAGACGCYRIHMEGYCDGIPPFRSETLADLLGPFDFWMGPGMAAYAHREAELPFDAHFLKALIAPRVLFVSEAAGDIWANPVGSWMTTMAAREAYRFLGCEDNLYWYFREGTHFHKVEDVQMLVNIIKHHRDPAVPLSDCLFHAPFAGMEPIYTTAPDAGKDQT